MNRRSFLRAAFCGALAGSRLAGAGGAAAGAAGRKLARIGLQLYTVREQLAADFGGMLEKIAALGFREVEFAGYHGRAPAEVKSALRRHGLLAPSAHVTTAELRRGIERATEAARVLGHRYLVSLDYLKRLRV